MLYFEYVSADGKYIIAVGTDHGQKEISKERYDEILELVSKRPKDTKDGTYMLTTSLEWVLVPYEKDGEK